MEYDFNANNALNDQSNESEGDSITIDNNDYEEYSDEFQVEENQNEDKKEENDQEQIKEKKQNQKSQKNKLSQQIHKNKKSKDMRTESNENLSKIKQSIFELF